MKFKRLISRAIIIGITVATMSTVYSAEVVHPENGAFGVLPGEKLTVNYSEPVNPDEKKISVNDSESNISNVTAEGNILTVEFKDMDEGKRYKTVIKNESGETELVTFFNTGFERFKSLIKFVGGNMDELWNGKSSQGAVVTADESELKIASNTKGSVGGRFNSTEFSLTATSQDVLIIHASSEETVDCKVYFSKTGGNKSFQDYVEINGLKGGGTTEEYRIPLGNIEGYTEEIKQILFEQSTLVENTITITGFEIQTLKNADSHFIGDFDLYSGYGSEDETKITGAVAESGTVTASLAAIQSENEKKVFLIIARYRDGVMTGASCVAEDISDGELHSAITVSAEAEAGETVMAFLRRGKEDITVLKECISAEIE